jgi:hypothetical protein
MDTATTRLVRILALAATLSLGKNSQTLDVNPALPVGEFLSFKQNDQSTAERYYSVVDPQNRRGTLQEWWVVNGFDQDGAGGVRAAYLNRNDLGLGRDMHCLQQSDAVACYVTNYGNPDGSPGNSELAWRADRARAGATVAMEYSAIEGSADPTKMVKFFVFRGGTGNAERIDGVDLDGRGEKFVPGLCVVCHGGNYVPALGANPQPSEGELGASFREFDLATYGYPAGGPRSAQELAFEQLNKIVLRTNPAPAIKDLITGWYADGGSQNRDYIPLGWADSAEHASLYENVVARSCRTCHVALDSYYSNNAISWTSFEQFKAERSQIRRFVCGDHKTMPHAGITFSNFWLSDSGKTPAYLAAFHDVGWEPFGECK